MYKHHPLLSTFLALASVAEMGQDERDISVNALTIACDILRASKKRFPKTANFPGKKSASRYVVTLAGDSKRPGKVICEVDELVIEQDVEKLEDFTNYDENWYDDSNASLHQEYSLDDEVGDDEGSSLAAASSVKVRTRERRASTQKKKIPNTLNRTVNRETWVKSVAAMMISITERD
ncbi:uncharacterized protein EKO05_0001280 [Ascochyta rabiei]|uniref:uncharacterized protein n=1 Tax=Didymella rabiei TaxID=5454 RepID=UPI002200A8AF|nr:uncharacterized protein EKO05_0001280 [Ascochyta rabiei]UPX10634.1 hypothetical protein EKO05_0001280 [Ascochyta rabiei]